MHHLQNTVSQKQFPYNKESTPLFLPHVRFEHGPLQPEFDILPKRQSSTFKTELPSVFIDFLSPFFWIQATATTLRPHTKQKTEKYKTSTVYIGQRQVTKMSQGNKKIKARKVPATKTGFLIRTGSLIQLVLFLRNTGNQL